MREMKDSGYSWLGKIPSSWKIKKVKHCFHRKNEKVMQNNPVVLSLARSGVKVRDISNNEGQIAESYFNYNPVDVDDILLNPMDLYSGANCSISKVKGVISPAYINLKALEGVNPGFFDYYFKVQYWLMAFFSYGKGVSFENRWTLNAEILMNYPLLVPEYCEQCKIKKYLDEKCSKIDVVIEKQKQIIEKLKAYKSSFITEIVSKGIEENRGLKKTEISWMGDIPETWKISHIGNLCEIGSGGTPDRNNPAFWDNGTIPWMASGEINFEYVYDTAEKITELGVNNSNAKILPVNTVMLGLIGQGRTKGLTAILKIESTCNQNLAYLKPEKTMLHYEYLFYCFKAMYKYIRSLVGESQAGIYQNMIKKLYIPLPPLEEQRLISEKLNRVCKAVDNEIEKRSLMINKLEKYKKSLIYECVTGKKEVLAQPDVFSKTGIDPTVLEQIRNHAKECGIHKVILFGSRARGTFHRDSDIDLAVSGGNIDLFRLAVEEETDTLLAYDVVNLDRTSNEELLDVIRKEGVIIYEEV